MIQRSGFKRLNWSLPGHHSHLLVRASAPLMSSSTSLPAPPATSDRVGLESGDRRSSCGLEGQGCLLLRGGGGGYMSNNKTVWRLTDPFLLQPRNFCRSGAI